jgi:hypothetical protein
LVVTAEAVLQQGEALKFALEVAPPVLSSQEKEVVQKVLLLARR